MAESRHFAFGKNWNDYSQTINNGMISEATQNLNRLLGNMDLTNVKVLDIGSGSGIHDVAFLRMGCESLVAFDFDLDSVKTTEKIIKQNYTGSNYQVYRDDILSLKYIPIAKYGLVYSWGVLHHTGNLEEAIRNSCGLVDVGGYFAVAVYRKTRLCNFWRIEKRFYSQAPRWIQLLFEALYVSVFAIKFTMIDRRSNFFQYVSRYEQSRGMKWIYDVRDWLGGYPYESISAQDLIDKFSELGFTLEIEFSSDPGLGLLGSGCDEFLFRKS
jgi:hypothetical protein